MVIGGIFLWSPAHVSAVECPDGKHVITGAEASQVKTATGYDLSGRCVDNNDLNQYMLATEGAADAATYLESVLCGSANMEEGLIIKKMDARFKICLASFMKKARATAGTTDACIREGWRSYETQLQYFRNYCPNTPLSTGKVCSNGKGKVAFPGTSKHGRGLAADINIGNGNNYPILHRLASSFGLKFPLPSSDRVHIIPASGNVVGDCNIGGISQEDADKYGYTSTGDYEDDAVYAKLLQEKGISDLFNSLFSGLNGGGANGGDTPYTDDLSSIVLDDTATNVDTSDVDTLDSFNFDDIYESSSDSSSSSGSVLDYVTDTASNAWNGITGLFTSQDSTSSTTSTPATGTVNTASDNPLGSRQTPMTGEGVTYTVDESGEEPKVVIVTFDASTGQEHIISEMTLEEFNVYRTTLGSSVTQQFHTAVDDAQAHMYTTRPYASLDYYYEATGDVDERIQALYTSSGTAVTPTRSSNNSLFSLVRGFANAASPSVSPLNPLGPSAYFTQLLGNYVNN